jgi:membrane-bound lytic murein transglycosylase B
LAEQRRGVGVPEFILIAIALCVMTAVGIAAASALTQTSSSELPEIAPTTVASAAPIIPPADAVAPAPTGLRVSADWVAGISTRTGISPIAMQAYGAATLKMGKEQPKCKLGWTTLAGIGGIESGHGTEAGAYLLPDGKTSQVILGPALDGTQGFAAIRATAESANWHGDTQWDHAVGPMQFIPSTWATWQSDGNDDGVKDPNNIFDAAYAAGRYLCESGSDLTTGPGWSRAVFSYNHSADYVRSVLAFANSYGAG